VGSVPLDDAILLLEACGSITDIIIQTTDLLAHHFPRPHLLSVPIVKEPVGHGSLAAHALAAATAERRGAEIFVTVPCDQIRASITLMAAAIDEAVEVASVSGISLVVTPAHTFSRHLGYITAAGNFVEKPNGPLPSGRWFVNTGIYVFATAFVLAHLERLHPRSIEVARRICTGEAPAVDEDWYSLPEQRLETAVLEGMGPLPMAISDGRWFDLGTWSTLYDYFVSEGLADKDMNVVLGPNVIAGDCGGCLVVSPHARLKIEGVSGKAVIAGYEGVYVGSL
jgi:mannose-1-phosphate guanylyltransferase